VCFVCFVVEMSFGCAERPLCSPGVRTKFRPSAEKVMNGLDWFLIVIGVICFGRGILRGAVSQLFGFVGVIGGLLLAAHSYESVARQLSTVFPGLPGTAAISFAVIFLLTWFCVGVSGYWTGRALRRTGLGFLDRLLGGAIGMAKAIVLGMISIALLAFLLAPQSPLLAQSTLTPYVQQATELLIKATPENLQKLFEEKQRTLKDRWLERGQKRTKIESATAEGATT
jgi:membrane protein required for colicin V production